MGSRPVGSAPCVRAGPSSPARSSPPLLSSLCGDGRDPPVEPAAHVPFQYTHAPGDDEQDATLDMMLIKNIHETGWFNTNPKLNAPFEQHWAEWPMGGDLARLHDEEGASSTRRATSRSRSTCSGSSRSRSPRMVAFPVLRSLRCSWATALVGAVLFSLAPYHFRNGVAHENLAFYVGVPVIVLLCVKILGPDSALPSVADLRHRRRVVAPPVAARRRGAGRR